MSDEQHPDSTPSEPSGGEEPDRAVEQDLDTLLVQASSLAAELSSQLGPSDSPSRPTEAAEQSDTAGQDPPDLDAQLEALNQLVSAAGEEVNVGPDESIETTPGKPATDPRVPALMEDSARPEADAPPTADVSDRAASPNAGTLGPAVPGVVGPGLVGVVGSTGPPEGVVMPHDLTPPGQGQPADREVDGTESEAVGMIAQRLPPFVVHASERVVGLLEQIDRPLGIVSEPVRRLAGWLAIATLGTALIVFLISLL